MSADIDPALLEAYADGELSPEETERVERHLAASPEDRRTVETLREMNAQLASAFDAPLRTPLTPAFRARLTATTESRRVRGWWSVAAGSAVAASIALAAGYLIGGYWDGSTQSGLAAGELAPSSPLHALLESGSDGSETNLGRGTATLSTTFIAGRGQPCREVHWSRASQASSTWAIACRRGEEWLVEIAVTRPDADPGAREAYFPAAGVGEEVIDAALEALGAGPVLGPGEVEDLIDAHWKPL